LEAFAILLAERNCHLLFFDDLNNFRKCQRSLKIKDWPSFGT